MSQAPRIVRWTLPALLLTLVVGGYPIVSAGGRKDSPGVGDSSTPSSGSRAKRKKATRVRRGDIASVIARHGHVGEIQPLERNPDVDPRALHPGQNLTIAP
jgi:LysM repeat protein